MINWALDNAKLSYQSCPWKVSYSPKWLTFFSNLFPFSLHHPTFTCFSIQVFHFKGEAFRQCLLFTKHTILCKNAGISSSSYSTTVNKHPWPQGPFHYLCSPPNPTPAAPREGPRCSGQHPLFPHFLTLSLLYSSLSCQQINTCPPSENLPSALTHWWGKCALASPFGESVWQQPLNSEMCMACAQQFHLSILENLHRCRSHCSNL